MTQPYGGQPEYDEQGRPRYDDPTRQYEQPYGQQPYGNQQYGQQQSGDPQYGNQQYGQQPYGNQQYGQQQYGQQQPQQPQQYGRPGYSPTAGAYGAPVGSGAKFGVVGVVFVGVGAILLIIAFTALNWGKTDGTSFSNLHRALDRVTGLSGLSTAYFGWLAWTLTIVLIVVGIAANLPSPASGPLRALGGIVGAAGIAFTFLAINFGGGISYGETLKGARFGFWFAVAGFLLAGIGALIGPQRR